MSPHTTPYYLFRCQYVSLESLTTRGKMRLHIRVPASLLDPQRESHLLTSILHLFCIVLFLNLSPAGKQGVTSFFTSVQKFDNPSKNSLYSSSISFLNSDCTKIRCYHCPNGCESPNGFLKECTMSPLYKQEEMKIQGQFSHIFPRPN
jgi:hypothetical protein